MSPPRKLAVILHADAVGSTTLVQINETIAQQGIQDVFGRFAGRIEAYRGIAHEIRGDAPVTAFSRASGALRAAGFPSEKQATSDSFLRLLIMEP
jgi:class 3 adenylate cyclase